VSEKVTTREAIASKNHISLNLTFTLLNLHLLEIFFKKEYQPSDAGGSHSQPATPHYLQRRTACNAALPAMPHCLQRRTACKIQNGHREPKNG